MSATPFALVSVENPDRIFAYGLDIDLASGREAITFRRDNSGNTSFGIHRSAETAHRRFSLVTPLELVWENRCQFCDTPTDSPVTPDEPAT